MRSLKPLVGLAALLSCLGALAAGFHPPAAPTRWVTDTAGLLSEATRRTLDARLQRYEQDTSHQVIIWIGGTPGDVPLEEWAARTFQAWGIGRKGHDDGVAVFVFAQTRQLRIEVGYGLEAVVPDALASRIIEEEALPRLRAGDPDAAMSATITALLRTLGGETSPPPPSDTYVQPAPELTPGQMIVLGVVGILVLLFVITHPRLAFFLLLQLLRGAGSNRRHGGGMGSGGLFRGRGGRSGGGGASGSW
jgi:uncharacterized protein